MSHDNLSEFLESHQDASALVYDEKTGRLLRAEYRRNVLSDPDWSTFGARHDDCDYFTEHDQRAVYLVEKEGQDG